MADKKISQLTPATTPLAGTETLPIVQGGNTVKTTVQDVANLASSPNPTNTFVPFNNAGTFADSYAVNDTTSEVFKTTHNSSDKGLKLDFANNQYLIGKDFGKATDDYSFFGVKNYSSGSKQYNIELSDTAEFNNKYTLNINPEEGYNSSFSDNSVNYTSVIYHGLGVGGINTYNNVENSYTNFQVNATGYSLYSTFNSNANTIDFIINSQNNEIKTLSNGNDVGLKLDFANNQYFFGDAYNELGLFCDIAGGVYTLGDAQSNVSYIRYDVQNNIFKTVNQGNDVGLKLDFQSSIYYLGDFANVASGAYFEADNDNSRSRIYSGSGYCNLDADGPSTQIGDFTGFQNGTRFGVNDSIESLSGTTNLLSNTAGGSSGQHLKIKIGTTQYKIALLNNA